MEEYLSVNEVAELAHVCKRTVYRWLALHMLEGAELRVEHGRTHWYIPRSALCAPRPPRGPRRTSRVD